jgi:hypothetical protein
MSEKPDVPNSDLGNDCGRFSFEPDGTLQLMKEHNIPMTRENYLRLAFAGNPPAEPLDAEVEAELPEQFQRRLVRLDDDINDAPSAGDSGEPSYRTPAGYPVCSQCGRSTRNCEALVCKPCRTGTRLSLTRADRNFLHSIGVAAR